MMSGAASVKAMKPRMALVVSGVAVAAYSGLDMALKLPAAAMAPADLMRSRRVTVPFALCFIVFVLFWGRLQTTKQGVCHCREPESARKEVFQPRFRTTLIPRG